jgi:anti-sigma-K factor RskA
MNEAHGPFEELAAGYALGALDAPDAARFERHLAGGCDACARALADYREALARVAAEGSAPPPARVRHAVLARVDGAAPRRPRIGLVVGWAASTALAAGIAAALTAGWVRTRYEARLDAVARDRAGQARTLALLADPATRVVTLAGLAPSPGAQGRMIWNGRAGGLLVTADLPRAPEGKVYELWAIAGGKPRPAGLFTVDAEGKATLHVAPIEGVAGVDVFAVTLEPAGGVPAPTGAMYLASSA